MWCGILCCTAGMEDEGLVSFGENGMDCPLYPSLSKFRVTVRDPDDFILGGRRIGFSVLCPRVPRTAPRDPWTHSYHLFMITSNRLNMEEPSAKPVETPSSWRDWSSQPSLSQVIALKRHLMHKLPIELVNIIISFAQYWPHVSNLSLTSRTIESGSDILPLSDSEASEEFRHELSELATDKDILLIRSLPLGFPSNMSQPWPPSMSKHPARILHVEVKLRWAMPVLAMRQRVDVSSESQTWLELGVLDSSLHVPKPRSLWPEPERKAQDAALKPPRREGSEHSMFNDLCALCHTTWLAYQEQCVPGCLRMNLFLDKIPEGQSAIIPFLCRIDDDERPIRTDDMDSEWNPPNLRDLGDDSRMRLVQYFNSFETRNTLDGAKFVRALEVGDELGVWSRVTNNDFMDGLVDPVVVIEGVRVTVFWEF